MHDNVMIQYAFVPAYSAPSHSQPGAGQLAQGMAAMKIATHGTVKPYAGFNAETDAQVLRKAMKGLGEFVVVSLVAMAMLFLLLMTDLKESRRECDRNLDLRKMWRIDITLQNNFPFLSGTDEKAIIGVIGARTNSQRQQIKTTYKQAYGRVSSPRCSHI